MEILKRRGHGYGGVIMIAPDGRYGFAHSTPRMAFAYADDSGRIQAYIKQ